MALPEPFLKFLITGAKDQTNFLLNTAGEDMGMCSATAKGIWKLLAQKNIDELNNLKNTHFNLDECMIRNNDGIWYFSYQEHVHYLIVLKINQRYYLLQSWETTFTLLWWLNEGGKIISPEKFKEFQYNDNNSFISELTQYRHDALQGYDTPNDLWEDFYKYTNRIFKKELTFDKIYSIKYSLFKKELIESILQTQLGGKKHKSRSSRKNKRRGKSRSRRKRTSITSSSRSTTSRNRL